MQKSVCLKLIIAQGAEFFLQVLHVRIIYVCTYVYVCVCVCVSICVFVCVCLYSYIYIYMCKQCMLEAPYHPGLLAFASSPAC